MDDFKLIWEEDKVLQATEKANEEITHQGALFIYQRAKKLCPVGKWEEGTVYRAQRGKSWTERKIGKLKNSIFISRSKFKEAGWIVGVPGQGSDTYYSKWVELGAPARSAEKWQTAGHKYPVPRQPFLRPARNWARRKIRQLYKEGFKGDQGDPRFEGHF